MLHRPTNIFYFVNTIMELFILFSWPLIQEKESQKLAFMFKENSLPQIPN